MPLILQPPDNPGLSPGEPVLLCAVCPACSSSHWFSHPPTQANHPLWQELDLCSAWRQTNPSSLDAPVTKFLDRLTNPAHVLALARGEKSEIIITKVKEENKNQP